MRPGKRKKAGRSLSLVLWFTFALFALLLILIFLAAQSFLVARRYRSSIVGIVRGAGEEMAAAVGEESSPYSIWKELSAIAKERGVDYLLLSADGRNVFPEGGDGDHSDLADEVRNRLTAEPVVFTLGEEIYYACPVSVEGESCYLAVSGSLARLNDVESGLVRGSLITAAFAVLLAFLAGGFVSMLITKPVAEVTEQAKELAHGHYELNFKRDYFCSEITELSDALDTARQEISKADAMQKELIANVSHDFKTPLTMIKAYASMIREISGDDPVKRDAHAAIIIEETDRLADLVGDLLDLSRLRAGVGTQAPVIFNLSETVYGIVSRFDYLAETQGYLFVTEIEDERYGFADRGRIEQVIYNLVSNAVNYTGEDKKVFVRLTAAKNYSHLEISDTGKGIPPEEIGTIWDRYYRSNETHKRPVQGTGLGLSIVKGILTAGQCPFGVRSEVGKGSTFWVDIPLPPEDLPKEGKEERE